MGWMGRVGYERPIGRSATGNAFYNKLLLLSVQWRKGNQTQPLAIRYPGMDAGTIPQTGEKSGIVFLTVNKINFWADESKPRELPSGN